jgi:cytochrome P450
MVEHHEPQPDVPATALLDPAAIEDPYGFYDRVRAAAPVWQVPGTSLFVVTSFAAIAEAVGRPQDFSSNIGAIIYRADDGTPALVPYGSAETNVLATADPPLHAVHRSTVFPELVNRRMAALRPEVDALAVEFIDRALTASNIEFMTAIADAVPIRVISRLVGWRDEDPEALFRAAIDSSSLLCATRSLDDALAGIERTAIVGVWIAGQLQQALDRPTGGLLGVIADAVRSGEIDHFAGIIMLHTLLSAGGESTTSLLGNAVHRLATDHDVQERLRRDPALTTPFVEEILRLESPFRYHMRHVAATTVLQGMTVPAGSTVLLMWGAANRDPAEYDAPHELRLDRPTPRHHLAFGRGIHLCVGAPLARLEADVVLTRLLERTAHITLDPRTAPVRDHSLMVRRFESLPLIVEPAGG